ncbi:MAG: glycosyltransferase family 4 protein [Eubacteriales bacterium]|nr:glycosyltransferase family 4 protein [Eubacteriales bacterium]
MTTVSITMGFFPAHIKMLQEAGHTVELACNLDEPTPEKVKALGCSEHHIPFSRSPFSKGNLTAYRELKKLLTEKHYDIVHTHTPNASALVRLACRKLRKSGLRVFYTAHGFHFYNGAPIKNWLIYYPVERLLSCWTDMLLTINSEDHQRAIKSFYAKNTVFVPGVGMDTAQFLPVGYASGRRSRELGLSDADKLLLSVGELNTNKNHAIVIRALAADRDRSVHYAICGEGSKRTELEQLADKLGIAERVHILGARRDVAQWMADADIYLFPSYREGLSVSLMEAMASGLPVVCSDIRGNRDLVQNEKGGLLCPPGDSKAWASAIRRLLEAREQRAEMGRYNQRAVQAFSKEKVLEELRTIYQI